MGMARFGKACVGHPVTVLGNVRFVAPDFVRLGVVRWGKVWFGNARRGEARTGTVRWGGVGLDMVWTGLVRSDAAG